jgi:hypothetical protein
MHPITKPGHWPTWPDALRGIRDYAVMGAIGWGLAWVVWWSFKS